MCNFHVKAFNSTQNDLMINYPKYLIHRSITNITCNMMTRDNVWKNLGLQIVKLNSLYFVSTEIVSAVMYLRWFLRLFLLDIFRFFFTVTCQSFTLERLDLFINLCQGSKVKTTLPQLPRFKNIWKFVSDRS